MKSILAVALLIVSILLFYEDTNAQIFWLTTNNYIEIDKKGNISLFSKEQNSIAEFDLEQPSMHAFLVGDDKLCIQTKDKSYTLSTDNLDVVYQLSIPDRLKNKEYYYYFKVRDYLVEVGIGQTDYMISYQNEEKTIQKIIGSTYKRDLPSLVLKNQQVWDEVNQVFYFNFPMSTEFYVIDFKANAMKNSYAESRIDAIKDLRSIRWYLDSKTGLVYFLAESSKNKANELYCFPEGLPRPDVTEEINGVKMSRYTSIWKDHNLLIDKIDYVPSIILNGEIK